MRVSVVRFQQMASVPLSRSALWPFGEISTSVMPRCEWPHLLQQQAVGQLAILHRLPAEHDGVRAVRRQGAAGDGRVLEVGGADQLSVGHIDLANLDAQHQDPVSGRRRHGVGGVAVDAVELLGPQGFHVEEIDPAIVLQQIRSFGRKAAD